MSKLQTDVTYFKDDVGKNLYRKKTYYTLVVEQDVLAKDKDEADKMFLDYGGIKHSAINKDIVDASDGVETYVVDANYSDCDNTQYLGKVSYDTDTYNQSLEEAEENEDIHIDTYAEEKQEYNQFDSFDAKWSDAYKEPMGVTGFTDKELSDVDVSIQLEAENARGK